MSKEEKTQKEPMSKLDIEGTAVDDLSKAEQELAEYLMKSGLLPEKGVKESSAAALQRRRQRYFENVDALMENYREFRHILTVLKECFSEAVADKTGLDEDKVHQEGGFFSALASSLDILSAKDEAKFNRIYAPQIQTGRKYEMALTAADFGMSYLKRQDPDGYTILDLLYVQGDTRPVMADILPKTPYTSQTTLYRKRAEALQTMSQAIFGFYPGDHQELYSTLIFLRQRKMDPAFGEPIE